MLLVMVVYCTAIGKVCMGNFWMFDIINVPKQILFSLVIMWFSSFCHTCPLCEDHHWHLFFFQELVPKNTQIDSFVECSKLNMSTSWYCLHNILDVQFWKFGMCHFDNPYIIVPSSSLCSLECSLDLAEIRISKNQLFIGYFTLIHPIILMVLIFKIINCCVLSFPMVREFVVLHLFSLLQYKPCTMTKWLVVHLVLHIFTSFHHFRIQKASSHDTACSLELCPQWLWFTLFVHKMCIIVPFPTSTRIWWYWFCTGTFRTDGWILPKLDVLEHWSMDTESTGRFANYAGSCLHPALYAMHALWLFTSSIARSTNVSIVWIRYILYGEFQSWIAG